MTALNGTPELAQDIGGLTALPGLEAVTEQLTGVITVLRAEQARRQAVIQITRPVWKNLVFTGGPGTGKSRVARALARAYEEMGLLRYGRLIEIAAADLTGTATRETRTLVGEAIQPTGDMLMITDAHSWHALPDRGQHVLRCLYQQLTEARNHYTNDELAVILSGQAGPLRDLLRTSPPLSARFPAIIDFPGYTPAQLAAVFTTVATEAGFTVTPAAISKAATVLARTEVGQVSGNARHAVRLLSQAAASHAHRIHTASQPQDPAALTRISVADIPEHLYPHEQETDDQWPGQYL